MKDKQLRSTCSKCSIPLRPESIEQYAGFCDVCYSMFMAASEQSGLVDAQIEWMCDVSAAIETKHRLLN